MRTRSSKLTTQIKRASRKPIDPPEKIDMGVLAPTGSTLLNLACSDRPDGGFALGRMVNIIGDSSTGKTLLALSIFAECSRLKQFDDYNFYYDDAEAKLAFNIKNLFGSKAHKRITDPPKGPSDTTQQFQDNLYTALDEDEPCIYVLDSFDALSCEEEQDKAEEDMAARTKGVETKGSYNMAKPKAASQLFRLICSKLKKTESILIIISQTRDKISAMTFAQKTRSGGNALYFYSTHEMWLAVVKQLESRKQNIGSVVKARVSKNHLTGKRRNVEFLIYYDYGIDSVGSCVDFLVSEGIWKKKGKITIVTSRELKDKQGTRAAVIKYIEDHNLEPRLVNLVARTWVEIEESLKLKRKRKYT